MSNKNKYYPKNADEILIDKLKEGKPEAFEEIYNRYWKKLLQFAILKTDSIEISKEIVQELFINLWERRSELEISNLEYYLFAATKYKIIKELKKKYKTESLSESTENYADNLPESSLETDELREKIAESINKLPTKTKEVFVKSRIENLSHKEISEALDVSQKAVEYHISQALKLLRMDLKNYLPLTILYCQTVDLNFTI